MIHLGSEHTLFVDELALHANKQLTSSLDEFAPAKVPGSNSLGRLTVFACDNFGCGIGSSGSGGKGGEPSCLRSIGVVRIGAEAGCPDVVVRRADESAERVPAEVQDLAQSVNQ